LHYHYLEIINLIKMIKNNEFLKLMEEFNLLFNKMDKNLDLKEYG